MSHRHIKQLSFAASFHSTCFFSVVSCKLGSSVQASFDNITLNQRVGPNNVKDHVKKYRSVTGSNHTPKVCLLQSKFRGFFCIWKRVRGQFNYSSLAEHDGSTNHLKHVYSQTKQNNKWLNTYQSRNKFANDRISPERECTKYWK